MTNSKVLPLASGCGWSVKDLLPDRQTQPLRPDRGGYTRTMREDAGAESCLRQLEQQAMGAAAGDGRLHLGWGSFRNLDIMAIRRSAWGLLCDINFHQFRVWDAVEQAIRDAVDGEDFVGRVVDVLPREPRLRQFGDCTRAWLLEDANRKGSWLSHRHPERFNHVKKLFAEGNIARLCLDMRGEGDGNGGEAFADLARKISLAGNDSQVWLDTLYLSNVPWMLAQPRGFFGEAHSDFLGDPAHAVIPLVFTNLRHVADHARWIVAACRLAPCSTAENLQWQTEVFDPRGFEAFASDFIREHADVPE